MLGGGTWSVQNKILPGCYISFISAAKANVALSDRGVIAFPMELNWGDTFNDLDFDTLMADSRKILGYDFTDDALINIREIFKNGTKLLLYRLNGTGVKASCTYATAKYAGIRGNDLKIVISNSIDVPGSYDVETYLGVNKVDKQTVAAAANLVDNDYVDFDKTATLAVTTGTSLTGGTNSTVDGAAYATAMDYLGNLAFNAIGFMTTDSTILSVIKSWVARMRDEVGSKFQAVIKGDADHEGIVSVVDENAIPWVTGAIGGCAINKSLTNKTYDGEKSLTNNYTQSQLETYITSGKFVFHKVGDDTNVLEDINSFTTFTPDKGQDFSFNQVIRVLDMIATTTASIFAKTYLGKVQNNADGRVSFKSQLVLMCEQMQNIAALQNFQSDDITVEEGNLKKAVVVNMAVTPVMAMEQLYMKCMVN